MKAKPHWGRFKLQRGDMRNSTDIVRRLLAGMIIVRAELNYASDSFEYEADSPLFAESEEHCVPFEYLIDVRDFLFVARRTERVEWQCSIWEMFQGKTPILIEPDGDMCAVRVGLDMNLVAVGLSGPDARIFCVEIKRELEGKTPDLASEHVGRAVERAKEKLKGTQ